MEYVMRLCNNNQIISPNTNLFFKYFVVSWCWKVLLCTVHIFICWYSHSIGVNPNLSWCLYFHRFISRFIFQFWGGLIDQKFGVIPQKFPKICLSILFFKCFWCLIFLNLIWLSTNMHVGISFWIRS